MITSSSKVEIGHGPPKAIIFNNIITKPHFKKFQNILKTDRQTKWRIKVTSCDQKKVIRVNQTG